MFVRPLWEEIGRLRGELVVTRDAITKTREVMRLRDELLDRYNSISPAERERVRMFLPAHASVGELLGDVDQLVRDAGMELRNINFQERIPSKGVSLPEGVEVVSVALSLEGTYEEFRALLDAFEHVIRLSDVTAISLSGGDVFQFIAEIQTYYQKDPLL